MSSLFHSKPSDPFSAVTHSNPYPYYTSLVRNNPFYYDSMLGIWIASSANAVTSVLTNNLCRVRPINKSVPLALLGSHAGDIFQNLVRMNDGYKHQRMKGPVLSSLNLIDNNQVTKQSLHWADALLAGSSSQINCGQLQEFAFRLPIYVIASLLGFPNEELPELANRINEFVKCLRSNASDSQINLGKKAGEQLYDYFQTLLETARNNESPRGLLSILASEVTHTGHEDDNPIIANGIGLLSQAYEATAGLIGNALLALADDDIIDKQVASDPSILHSLIQEVLRYDPPIQNTRRFVSKKIHIAGQLVHEGETILVLLAGANRDATVNPNPDLFDLHRTDPQLFTFGIGKHACPGKTLAVTIAQAGIRHLINSNLEIKTLRENVTYYPSTNSRIPTWPRKDILL